MDEEFAILAREAEMMQRLRQDAEWQAAKERVEAAEEAVTEAEEAWGEVETRLRLKYATNKAA